MSEHLILPHASPYKQCFESIETVAASQPLTPIEAYRLYDDYLVKNGLDPIIYLSMAITSGGYKRDEQLGMGEVIGKNTEFGSLAAGALIEHFPGFDLSDIIVPSELGKVKNWSQSDYLLFWAHVIVGDKPEILEVVEKIVVDSGARELEGFSDSSLSDTERWRDYSTFISTYVNAYAQVPGDTQPNNMQAVIFILDKEMSLGARAEELLSRKLGIPPQFQPFDSDVLWRTEEEFRQHVIQFRLLGATALGAMLNPPDEEFPFSYAGISQGKVDTRAAVHHGIRKPSLINAILAKEFYNNHPGTRPPRHQGHRPLHFRS